MGLYPFLRSLYRRFSLTHQKEYFFNQRFYSELVTSGDLCFDIGANVGQTIEALISVHSVVIAVEPNPNCLPVLKYQFQWNKNVTLVMKAVGASTGYADFYCHGTDSTASLRNDWPHLHDEVIRVDVTTLDELIGEFGLPKLIKVDVEGRELEVFQGLSHPVSLICFEMHLQEADLAISVLQRIASIGQILGVNAVSGDNAIWLLDDWVSSEQFIREQINLLPERANILIKMAV